jgi:hypothetical protein
MKASLLIIVVALAGCGVVQAPTSDASAGDARLLTVDGAPIADALTSIDAAPSLDSGLDANVCPIGEDYTIENTCYVCIDIQGMDGCTTCQQKVHGPVGMEQITYTAGDCCYVRCCHPTWPSC